ncbi:MAG: mannose-1-phosphate guanylyltransferase [Candidatus Fermentibacteraceae bacterium]
MAGGRGTRFWPLSTSAKPKQFLELLPGGTMLQLTADRLAVVCGLDNIIVVAGREHANLVLEQLPWLDAENLLLEPVGRNTAPCIGWAASVLAERGHGDSTMLVMASDHLIHPVEEFARTTRVAVSAAESGNLVTMGITPGHPATGYGYIEKGTEVLKGVFKVKSFREKPDPDTARRFLDSGSYLWNSGMFVWKVSGILEALGEHMPELLEGLAGLGVCIRPEIDVFSALPAVSVDVGVMEKAGNAVVVPASFQWSDIGDWPGARDAGVSRGETILVDSENTLVYDATGRLTVIMGLRNVSVVCTDTATLVMADSCAQKLREVSEKLNEC